MAWHDAYPVYHIPHQACSDVTHKYFVAHIIFKRLKHEHPEFRFHTKYPGFRPKRGLQIQIQPLPTL